MTNQPKKLTVADVLSRTRALTDELAIATAEHEATALSHVYGHATKEDVEQARAKATALSADLDNLSAANRAAGRENIATAETAQAELRREAQAKVATLGAERAKVLRLFFSKLDSLGETIGVLNGIDSEVRRAVAPIGLNPGQRAELAALLGVPSQLAALLRVALYQTGLGTLAVVPADWQFAPIDASRHQLIAYLTDALKLIAAD